MQKPVIRMLVFGCSIFLGMRQPGHCQSASFTDPSPSPAAPTVAVSAPKPSATPDLGRVGVGVKMSLLGGGIELAARVTHHSNLRAGFNMISYSRTFNKDGIAYQGELDFKTVEAHYDIFPFAGRFHISPGVLAYIGDPITASLKVPAGQSFSLGGQQFFSDSTTPVTGNGKIDFNRVAPTITAGWGNLVSRDSKHFSVPFEIGAAFQGAPKATLNLAGSVCDSPNANCRSVASDPAVLGQVVSEQTKLNNSMRFFKVYPIISIGLGYKF